MRCLIPQGILRADDKRDSTSNVSLPMALALIASETIKTVSTLGASNTDIKEDESAGVSQDVGLENFKSFGAKNHMKRMKELFSTILDDTEDPVQREARKKLAESRLKDIVISAPKAEQIQSEFDEMAKKAYIRTNEDMNNALSKDNTLVIHFRANHREPAHIESLSLRPHTYDTLKRFLYGIDDNHIKQAFSAEEASRILRNKVTDEKSYMTDCLLRLANSNDAMQSWVHSQISECHPMYQSDGYHLNRDMLASDLWDVVELPGAGEVWYLKDFKPKIPVLLDYLLNQKLLTASLLDRRLLGAEFDLSRAPSFFGKILMYAQNLVSSYFNMVRPADLDKPYFFKTESELPYPGIKAADDNPAKYENAFLVSAGAASILNNVPDPTRPLRVIDRHSVFDMSEFLQDIKSSAAMGGQVQNLRNEEEGKPLDS